MSSRSAATATGCARTTLEAYQARRRLLIDRRSRHRRWREAVAELVTLQSEYAQGSRPLPEP
jgi:transposase